MKKLIFLAIFIALSESIDLTQIKIPDITPELTGMTISETRIVGGDEVVPHTRPYQVALLITTSSSDVYFCGGSLISTKFVLTAAHCVDKANTTTVILGAHKFDEEEAGQVRLTANKFHIHKDWKLKKLINDIATIELDEEVKLSVTIKLIDMPKYSDISNTFEGETAVVSGWGVDSDSSNVVSPVLREVAVNVICNKICLVQYAGIIRSSHLCTSGMDGVGACSGDSGGALVIGNTQIGIVSFGHKASCESGWPTVFTRITSYLSWIEANSDITIYS